MDEAAFDGRDDLAVVFGGDAGFDTSSDGGFSFGSSFGSLGKRGAGLPRFSDPFSYATRTF